MSNPIDPVYVDPFDEGFHAAKEGLVDALLLAQPAEQIAERLAYSAHDWRRFRQGALKALMGDAA